MREQRKRFNFQNGCEEFLFSHNTSLACHGVLDSNILNTKIAASLLYRASRDATADNMDQFAGIKKSGKHGKGLFALKDFKKSKRVYVSKKGKIVGRDEIKNLSEVERMHLDKIGENEYEVVESPGCYVNHSCEPNVTEKDRIGYALKDIKKGEEITLDYDKVAYLEEPFKCRCGSRKCRGFGRGRK